MLCADYTTTILGLKDISVRFVKEYKYYLNIGIESTETASLCHCCSAPTRIHTYRTQRFKDLSFRASLLYFSKKKALAMPCLSQIFLRKALFPA